MRGALVILGLTLLGVGAYVYYGWSLDWELFKQIVSIQGVRFAGWSGLTHMLTTPAYDIFTISDGWYVFALLSAVYFVFKGDKTKEEWLVTLFFVYWMLVAHLS